MWSTSSIPGTMLGQYQAIYDQITVFLLGDSGEVLPPSVSVGPGPNQLPFPETGNRS
jgi:hypothetical protein